MHPLGPKNSRPACCLAGAFFHASFLLFQGDAHCGWRASMQLRSISASGVLYKVTGNPPHAAFRLIPSPMTLLRNQDEDAVFQLAVCASPHVNWRGKIVGTLQNQRRNIAGNRIFDLNGCRGDWPTFTASCLHSRHVQIRELRKVQDRCSCSPHPHNVHAEYRQRSELS